MTALNPCHLAVITCLESDGYEVHHLGSHSVIARAPLNGGGLPLTRWDSKSSHIKHPEVFYSCLQHILRSASVRPVPFTPPHCVPLTSGSVNNRMMNCSLISL